MVWHYDVCRDEEAVLVADGFELLFEDIASGWVFQVRLAMETTERDEMWLAASLKAS